ncbi:sensor histidine kinase [Nocardioides sp. Bht2]|uniref:sensor histidine kinase n=1 Tax=Nocardioides sp. Bht2 TaxID=3392297 RepID=UPI0039B5CABB
MGATTSRANQVQRAAPAVALAAAVLALGYAYRDDGLTFSSGQVQLISILTAGAVAIAWRWQAAALGLIWLLLAFHVTAGLLFLPTELAIAFVAFACAAWGSRWTLALSLFSIPLAAAVCAQVFLHTRDDEPRMLSWWLSDLGLRGLAESAQNSSFGPTLVVGVIGLLGLLVPWLVGLAVRLMRRSDASLQTAQRAESERESAEAARTVAEDVAHVREAQAQLARDVHDVVGHSLTVILAQAEAAQYQDDAAVKQTLATIADTARASLADVRQVLHNTGPIPIVPAEQDLHDLLAGVRAGGREVLLSDVGEARPLPPDRAAAAHRVLQEMLTNAVRHGAPGPITLERHWGGDLRLEVTNPAFDAAETAAAPTVALSGHGVEGMRRRLEAVGGHLDIRSRANPPTFTATAWIPLPGRFEEPHR